MIPWEESFSKPLVTNWLLLMLLFTAFYIAKRLEEIREAVESFNSDYLDGSGLGAKYHDELEDI